MANTLVKMGDFKTLAQIMLDIMVSELIPVTAFSHNLTNEQLIKGKTVSVRQFVEPGASKDFVKGDPAANYGATDDLQENEVEVTMDKHLFKSFELSDEELDAGAVYQKQLELYARRLAKDALIYLWGKILAADFTSSLNVNPIGSYDHLVQTQLFGQAANAGFDLAQTSAILNTDAYTALVQNVIGANNGGATGENALVNGNVMKIGGINTIPYHNMPANAESLRGVIVDPRALLVGSAVPRGREKIAGLGNASITRIQQATDPETGLTIQIRLFERPEDGCFVFVVEILLGAKAGNTPAIIRITEL